MDNSYIFTLLVTSEQEEAIKVLFTENKWTYRKTDLKNLSHDELQNYLDKDVSENIDIHRRCPNSLLKSEDKLISDENDVNRKALDNLSESEDTVIDPKSMGKNENLYKPYLDCDIQLHRLESDTSNCRTAPVFTDKSQVCPQPMGNLKSETSCDNAFSLSKTVVSPNEKDMYLQQTCREPSSYNLNKNTCETHEPSSSENHILLAGSGSDCDKLALQKQTDTGSLGWRDLCIHSDKMLLNYLYQQSYIVELKSSYTLEEVLIIDKTITELFNVHHKIEIISDAKPEESEMDIQLDENASVENKTISQESPIPDVSITDLKCSDQVADVSKSSQITHIKVASNKKSVKSIKAQKNHEPKRNKTNKNNAKLRQSKKKVRLQSKARSASPENAAKSDEQNISSIKLDTKSSVKTIQLLQVEEKIDAFRQKPHNCSLKQTAVTSYLLKGSKKEFLCDLCGSKFAEKKVLVTHRKYVHTDERPEKCDKCNLRFKNKSQLYNHAVVHKTELELDLSCEVCGKRFHRAGTLKDHVRRHKKEFSHFCTICGKGFYKQFYLEEHFRVHSGVKPYECKICGFKVALKCNLNKHMKIHRT